MFVEAVRQLRNALFEFLPSGGVNGCKSHILMLFELRCYRFLKQMYAGDWAFRRHKERAGSPRREQENREVICAYPLYLILTAPASVLLLDK